MSLNGNLSDFPLGDIIPLFNNVRKIKFKVFAGPLKMKLLNQISRKI
jgi:hypothetical protein